EINFKKNLIYELLKKNEIKIENFEIEFNNNYYQYRNKLEFSFLDDEIEYAFFKRGTHKRKIKINGCLLGYESINYVARKILDYLKENNFDPKILKSLILRGNREKEVIASLFVREKKVSFNKNIEIENLSYFSIYFSDPKSPASIKSDIIFEKGTPFLKEKILDKTFYFSNTSFFQVNIDMFEKTLLDMKNYVDSDESVFDVYSGVGTIGIGLDLKNVTFIESEKENINLKRMNLEINGIRNFRIIERRAEDVISLIDKNSIIILDPPREGLHKKVIEEILKKEVKRVIYLSCNPLTQIRDLISLSQKYDIVFFKGYNYFPRTPHIETLLILDKKV
ncbi:MAG: class I SAM-dependent RNA methyltransferase, partial [Caldisericia bacterium]|nr:class I SAM-dependent RNA methyltransferase [Caldisericia bacterium]